MSPPDAHAHLDSPALLACRELARAVDLFDEAACHVLGIGRSDLRALNLLEHGPLGAGVLAERLGLTRPAVTALVDRLVGAGYVARVPVPDDRRATGVELRPDTWRAFAAVYRPLGERVHAALGALTERDRRAVVSALATMSEVFRDARDRLGRPGPAAPGTSGAARLR